MPGSEARPEAFSKPGKCPKRIVHGYIVGGGGSGVGVVVASSNPDVAAPVDAFRRGDEIGPAATV
ncbi:MAG: hypothetical protein ABI386_02655 [Rhodanobacter sp.]